MTERTLRATMDLSLSQDDIAITIGGGEPTLHPQFWQFLGIILSYRRPNDGFYLGIITNGSQTDTALALAGLAQQGLIWAALSQDRWHDPIDPIVVRAFTKPAAEFPFRNSNERDLRSIRKVDLLQKIGRAKRLSNYADFNSYQNCCGPFVNPKGVIYSCDCKAETFGTVFEPKFPDNWRDLQEYSYCGRHPEDARRELALAKG